MANYGYISLGKRILANDFYTLLQEVVMTTLGDKWQVRLAAYEIDGVTWEVFVPDTACNSDEEALKRWLAPGEDVGFPVALDAHEEGSKVVFRHSSQPFERWAQGCVEEALADRLKTGVFYDATDETLPPGTRRYRKYGSFYEYVIRGFTKPLSEDDKTYINERYKDLVPEGFWN